MSGITERLAEFVTTTQWQDLPTPVVHEAKRALVNYYATALAGCRDGTVENAAVVLRRFEAHATATVIGRDERSDIPTTTCLNAMSANVFDFDDTHMPTVIHPTAPVAPALFAWSESTLLSGPELLLAFVLGVEIECRLGNAISPWHYQRGWHITSTCGVFGAATAIGKVIGLDPVRMRWALGNAAAQSSGLVETLGTMSKSIGVGNSARNGLISALLAQADFSGPAQPLEGERGFLRVMGNDADLGAVTEGLGEHWEILSNTYKPYPCGVVLNPVIEACLELAKSNKFSAEDIAHIEVVGHPLLRERTDRPQPTSGREAQVSARHGIAVALTHAQAGLAEFSDAAVVDPALRAYAPLVRFVDDVSYPIESARVTIQMCNGAGFTSFVEGARGSTARPLSDSDLEQKLIDLTKYGRSGCDPRPLIDAIWSLDQSNDAGALMRLAAGHRDIEVRT